jgi:hypothetical protein
MEGRRVLDHPQGWKALRRGWCVGSEEFRRELLEQMEGKIGRQERQETTEQRARLVPRQRRGQPLR